MRADRCQTTDRMSADRISIVVPAHNVGNYIATALAVDEPVSLRLLLRAAFVTANGRLLRTMVAQLYRAGRLPGQTKR